jgi:ATP-binding cassette subfamily B protein
MRVIAGDLRHLYGLTLLNVVHLMLRGAPVGILFLVILELLGPRDQIDVARLVLLFLAMAAIMLADLFLAVRVHVLGYVSAYALGTKARLRLGDHLRLLSLGFFKKRDPGDISALLLQDMAKVESIFAHFFLDALACLVLPAMMCAFFLVRDWRLTLLMVAAVAVAVPTLLLAGRLIDRFGRRHIVSRNRTASRLLEYLQGIKVLKAFCLTGRNFKRLDATMRRLRDDSIRLEAVAGAPVMCYVVILELGFVGLLVYGAQLYAAGGITAPVFVLFLVVGYKFFEPLINFGVFVSEMRYMNIAAGRIAAVMDTPPLPEPAEPAVPRSMDIVFDRVGFGYGQTRVLHDLSFRVPEKGMTALVGPSGSGKTTITSLLVRFWDVDAGGISIGGADIRSIPAQTLNALVSVVFQEVYLFRDTILGNIRIGKRDATRAEVIRAAKAARCHDFIENMEKGYDTMVGEGGATLSGGEKQRLSIARALLKDAPIVILDEATASLDPENELLIQQAIAAMVRSKTLIVIAHRLKTIARADQILVVDKGRIGQSGVHEALLASGGLYAALWNEQQRAGGWKFRGAAGPAPDARPVPAGPGVAA